jgi:hypothetical protein
VAGRVALHESRRHAAVGRDPIDRLSLRTGKENVAFPAPRARIGRARLYVADWDGSAAQDLDALQLARPGEVSEGATVGGPESGRGSFGAREQTWLGGTQRPRPQPGSALGIRHDVGNLGTVGGEGQERGLERVDEAPAGRGRLRESQSFGEPGPMGTIGHDEGCARDERGAHGDGLELELDVADGPPPPRRILRKADPNEAVQRRRAVGTERGKSRRI